MAITIPSSPSAAGHSSRASRIARIRLKDPESALRVAATLGVFLLSVGQAYRLARAAREINTTTTAKKKRSETQRTTLSEEDTPGKAGELVLTDADASSSGLLTRMLVPNSMVQRFTALRRLLDASWDGTAVFDKIVTYGILAGVLGTSLGKVIGQLYVWKLTSTIDAIILRKKDPPLYKLLSYMLAIGIPVATLQCSSAYLAGQFSLRLKTKLVKRLLREIIFSSHNLDEPVSMIDKDTLALILSHINKVSTTFVELYWTRTMKAVDLVVYAGALMAQHGPWPVLVMLFYLFSTLKITTELQATRQEMLMESAHLESTVNEALTRAVRHRESISAWQGRGYLETKQIFAQLELLQRSKSSRAWFDLLLGFMSTLGSKYIGSALGFWLTSYPYIASRNRRFAHMSTRPSEVVKAGMILLRVINLQDYFGIISYFWTARIMMNLCTAFVQFMDDRASQEAGDKLYAKIYKLHQLLVTAPSTLPKAHRKFKVRMTNVSLKGVTIQSPSGPILVQSLTLDLNPGCCIALSGPSGSGKSALLRTLNGTWPICIGELARPKHGVMLVPQKLYMLRESSAKQQIAYPDGPPESSADEDRVAQCMRICELDRLSGRHTLSEAEQERVVLARLLYHKPKFALIDDCLRCTDPKLVGEVVSILRQDAGCGIVIVCPKPDKVEALSRYIHFDGILTLDNKTTPPRHSYTACSAVPVPLADVKAKT
ncbi:ATP-binding cassette sub- D member 2 [Perkinsus olseni]|uniref:ATP-binding cassette sub- D member 2 n=1 Tax=Perkinsus olseni TaxID=32597 RepID=A0A7J6SA81_PEROL|nr:ATP-binding cassette sub- D member 2 [Perkinsus olseni]